MKEYKIIKQKMKLLHNNDALFEKELNQYASSGWRVVNTIYGGPSFPIKVILERDKNR